MNDKIVKIEFNIWANGPEEGEQLKKAVCDFIDWHGQRGVKVSAGRLLGMMKKWQGNALVKNAIMNQLK